MASPTLRSTSARAADVAPGRSSAGDLAQLLLPTLDEVAGRCHGMIDHADEALRGTVREAERSLERLGRHAEVRVGRATRVAGDEASRVVGDLHVRLEQWAQNAERGAGLVVEAFQARLLAILVAAVVAYAAYFHMQSQAADVSLPGVLLLTWMGTTLITLIVGLAWALLGRSSEQLKVIFRAFATILALVSLAALVVIVMGQVPPLTIE